MSCIFLPLCMLGNFWLDARHCEFNFGRCWIFLYSYKYSCAFFWDAVIWKLFDTFASAF
jgi:hypothetical protein